MIIKRWEKLLDEFHQFSVVPGYQGDLSGILTIRPRVVLFDIYGTLVKPLLGDLDDQARTKIGMESFKKTAVRFGFEMAKGEEWYNAFFQAIYKIHDQMKEIGIIRPEVLVEKIWQDVLRQSGIRVTLREAKSFAIYREMIANPVAPFEGARQCVKELKKTGYKIGIVSNSQFYTLPILEAVLGLKPEEFFDPELIFLSFQLGFAKPDPYFFLLVKTKLAIEGIDPREVVIVGNDWDNDIRGALQFGFQAVFFGGEGRCKKNQRGKVVDGIPISYKYEHLKQLFEPFQ